MKRILPLISFAGLSLVIVPIITYVAGYLEKPAMFNFLLIGTIIWFVTVPWWMSAE